jgi:type I restriction enzyme S subunit
MELKKGYKKTELGVIPEDWDVKPLGELIEFVEYGSSTKSLSNGRVPVLRMGNLQEGKLNWNDLVYTNNENEIAKYELHKNDVLFNRTNSIDLVGKTSIYNGEIKAIFAGYLIRIRTNKNKLNPEYLNYILNTPFAKGYGKSVVSMGVSQANINGQKLKSYPIPFPPTTDEQDKIANTLSDTDALITSIEKLIAKKRLIKQGVMQKLLAPKEGWEVKTLGEVSKFRRGSFPQPYGLDKWYDDIKGYPFVQVFDVDKNNKIKPDTKRHISKEAQPFSVFTKKGTIILTIQGSIGRIAITQYDAYIDRTLLIFEEMKVPFNNYFFMLLVHDIFEKEKQAAPGGIIKTITKAALSSFEIKYPQSIEEQTRIATILSDMETEIETLETKLAKYKQIKQGMMQNLLTGKIRLVKPKSNELEENINMAAEPNENYTKN